MSAGAHLLLVESKDDLRAALAAYLKKNGFLVSTARDAAHARRLLGGLEFDLVVLDGALADAAALALGLAGPMLVMTGHDDTAFAGRPRIERPCEPAALLQAIRSALGQDKPSEAKSRALRLGDLVFDPESGALTRGGAPVRLTATETCLMRALAAHPGQPVTRAALMAQIGNAEGGLGPRAVDVQITRLRRKVEHDPRAPRYLQTVRGLGYKLDDQG